MDEYFYLQGLIFEWDAEKVRTNPLDHDGVTFRQAAEAFFDPNLRGLDASRNQEIRDAIIGFDFNRRLLFVVHIEIDDDVIRIISARYANKREERFYADE